MTDVGAEASAELDRFEPCLHCRGRARLEAHATFRWVCGVCGGPRVPAEARVRSERGASELRAADEARKMAFAWRLGAVGLLLTGTLLAALGATLALASTAVSLAVLVTAIALYVGGAFAHRRAKGMSEKAKSAIFAAWESAAESVLKSRDGTFTASELAKTLETSEEDVERMMTFLAADDRAIVELKDAEVVYSAKGPLEPRAESPSEAAPQPPARVAASVPTEAEPHARAVAEAAAEREAEEESHGTDASSADPRRG